MLDSRGQTAVSEEPEDYYGIAGEYGKSWTKIICTPLMINVLNAF